MDSECPIAIVTVAFVSDVIDGMLNVTSSPSTTATAEQACGIPPSRYFYAGRAFPERGEVALGYAAPAERAHTGGVVPFDTGGLYAGHLAPCNREMAEDERATIATRLINDAQRPLTKWRAGFQEFVESVFDGRFEAYFSDSLPEKRAECWGTADLPIWAPANQGNWRSWAWEVRFHQAHDVAASLAYWTCTEGARTDLQMRAIEDDAPPSVIKLVQTEPSFVGPEFQEQSEVVALRLLQMDR